VVVLNTYNINYDGLVLLFFVELRVFFGWRMEKGCGSYEASQNFMEARK